MGVVDVVSVFEGAHGEQILNAFNEDGSADDAGHEQGGTEGIDEDDKAHDDRDNGDNQLELPAADIHAAEVKGGLKLEEAGDQQDYADNSGDDGDEKALHEIDQQA